jgi:hypothetical protein
MITFTRSSHGNCEVVISPVPAWAVSRAILVMRDHHIPEARNSPGYVIGEGAILIAGNEYYVTRAADIIDAIVRGGS